MILSKRRMEEKPGLNVVEHMETDLGVLMENLKGKNKDNEGVHG